MTIRTVYQRYRIMPNLQVHQLRVAAVAQFIINHLKPVFASEVDAKSVITACLLHDMGNIIKFDLTVFPEFLEPQGLNYWQGVQQEYLDLYGPNEHHASMAIAREIGASEEVITLIDSIGFSKTRENMESGSLNRMLGEYADDRVTPHGVVGLEERIEDLERRYGPKYPQPEQVAQRREFARFARAIEKHIFARATILPANLTDQTLAPIIADLEDWQL
jgi:hypothetical protein